MVDKVHPKRSPQPQPPASPAQGQGQTPTKTLTVVQTSPAGLTAVHTVSNLVLRPPVTASPGANFRFAEGPADGEMHEFLYQVVKPGGVFWIGVAVPKGTTDFTRAQVYFHPTVVQKKMVIADDKDYPEFGGKWKHLPDREGMQRYVPMQGGQLAATGRLLPLLVPFTTMAALSGGASNIFSDRPKETLEAVLDAVRVEVTGQVGRNPPLSALGVASFSSGILAMRLFLGKLGSTGLIKEVTDFDSPFLVKEPKMLTRLAGARSRCFTQVASPHPQVGYVVVTKGHFVAVSSYSGRPVDARTHPRIGFMMYFQAMVTSVLK